MTNELLAANDWSCLKSCVESCGTPGVNVLCKQHLDVMHTFQKLIKSQLFENLNDAYIQMMPNNIQIIVLMRNRELAFCKKGIFFGGELQSSMRISHVHASGNFGFHC